MLLLLLVVIAIFDFQANAWPEGQVEIFSKKFHEVLQVYKPFLTSQNRKYSLVIPRSENVPLNWELISEEPKSIGTLSNQVLEGSSKHSHTYIFIICLQRVQNIRELIPDFINPRKDSFIFLGISKSVLEEFMESPDGQKLQQKVGIYFDPELGEGKFIADPHHKLFLSLNKDTELVLRPPSLMANRLGGQHFRCSGSLIAPYIFPTDSFNEFGEKLDGTHYRVISQSSQHFNFSFQSFAPPGQGYGTLLPNGTWIHMLSDIYYEDRDYEIAYNLALAFIWDGLVEYAAPLGQTRVTFMIRHPLTLAFKMEAFLLPFQPHVWAAFVALFLVLCIAVYISFKYSPLVKKGVKGSGGPTEQMEPLYQSLWIPYAITMGQGVNPQGVKILCILWLLLIINLGTGYQSNLISYLSIPVKETIPRNVQDLADREDYRVVVNNLGAIEKAFFEYSDLESVKKLRTRIEWDPNTESCVTSALVNKKTVCMGWDQVILLKAAERFTIQPEVEPLYESADGMTDIYLTLAFRKGFQYEEDLRMISYSFYESGIFGKWEAEVYKGFKDRGVRRMKRDQRSNVYRIISEYVRNLERSSVNSLQIDNLKIAFIILGVGASFALLSYLVEVV